MAFDSRSQNDLARLTLIACDAAYGGNRLTIDTRLAPYADPHPIQPPYAIPPNEFKVDRTIESANTGLKVVLFKDEVANEVIVAFAGTDGLDARDWFANSVH
jgi:hypothetical protein